MESPYPPQLSLSQAGAAVGPSPPSNPSPASVGQAAPVASTSSSTASAEPRQQQRKRTLPDDDDADERGFDRGAAAGDADDGCSEGGETEAARPRGLSARRGARGDVARRLAGRAKGGERRAWMARSASEGGDAEIAAAGGPSDALRPQDKRRRLEEEDEDADEPAYQASSGAPEHAPPPRPPPLVLSPYCDAQDAESTSPSSSSPYLGVFPTACAAEVAPEPSASQPPPPSPRLPPPSAGPAQLPFPARSAHFIPTLPTIRPPSRRRANSLPAASNRSSPAYVSPSALFHLQKYAESQTTPKRRQRPTVSTSRDRLRRSPAPGLPDSLGGAPVAFLSGDDLLAFHAAHIRATEGEDAKGELTFAGTIPPVTRTTLRELDLQEIVRNPQLRHDVVFDPNLMGDRKRMIAEQYWMAVAREIDAGCRCTAFRNNILVPCICGPSPSSPSYVAPLATRLPSRIEPLVAELRNILVSLLPAPSAPNSPNLSSSPTFASPAALSSPSLPSPSSPYSPAALAASREQLIEVLDPAHLTQQLAHGCADIPALARFLGMTVKQHCAPMRDEMVDAMVRACEGEGLAKGLKMCFEILELMKLDIANHQLRSLRPYLVRTALEFERRVYQDFAERRAGPGCFDRIRAWLHSSADGLVGEKVEPRALSKDGHVDAVTTQGLLDLVLPDAAGPPLASVAALPKTLQLDSYRLQAFHADATDLTVVYLLTMLFGQLAYPARPSPADVDALRQELWCIMASSTKSPSSLAGPAAFILGIPQGPPGLGLAKLDNAAWRAGMQDVLLQVARRATEIRARAAGEPATTFAPLPDAETLALVGAYFETNVRASSKLFQLLQRRLRETLRVVVDEELAREKAHGPMSFTGWWVPQTAPASMTTGGARRYVPLHELASARPSSHAVRPDAGMMASPAPERGVKRSHLDGDDADESSSGSEDEGADKRQRTGRSSSISTRTAPIVAQLSAIDAALQRNGLTALSGEVRLLGMRIARVAAFNLAVYRPLYAGWLSLPPPPSPA
ncbi:Protein SOSEKI 1 [Rhodotorula kratochvilovae]